jgi:hypothetical protein
MEQERSPRRIGGGFSWKIFVCTFGSKSLYKILHFNFFCTENIFYLFFCVYKYPKSTSFCEVARTKKRKRGESRLLSRPPLSLRLWLSASDLSRYAPSDPRCIRFAKLNAFCFKRLQYYLQQVYAMYRIVYGFVSTLKINKHNILETCRNLGQQ